MQECSPNNSGFIDAQENRNCFPSPNNSGFIDAQLSGDRHAWFHWNDDFFLVQVFPVQSIGFFRQARSQDQFGGGVEPQKCGPFGPKKWTFWTSSAPLILLQKSHFWPILWLKEDLLADYGGALHPLHPPGYGPVFRCFHIPCKILSHISKAFLCNFRLSHKAFCYTHNY